MSRIPRVLLNNPSFLSYSHLLIDDEYERVLLLSEFRATRHACSPLSQLDAKKLGENLRNAARRKLNISTRNSSNIISFLPNTVLHQLNVASQSRRAISSSRKQDPTRRTKKKMEKIDSSNRIVSSFHRPSSTGKIRNGFRRRSERRILVRPITPRYTYLMLLLLPVTTGQICLSNISASRYK